MTIRPGTEWGRSVAPPAQARAAEHDADVTRLLGEAPSEPVLVVGGDLARTLGTPPPARTTVLELPLDLVEVTTDAGVTMACAHVIARSPWWRGGWWLGPTLAVMNAQFLGDWDLAPRGHPNDGRVEIIEGDPALTLRDRIAVRQRLPSGTFAPHPRIATRSVREASWQFSPPRAVWIDGVAHGTSGRLAVRVVPDAAIVHH